MENNSNAAQINTNAATDTNTTQANVTQTQAAPPAAQVNVTQVDATNAANKPDAASEVKYELKLEEGSLLDKSRIAEIEAYAKDKKLTNEQAQDLLNREHLAISKFQTAQEQMFETKKEQWKQEVLADKELGGDNFNRNIEYAHRALGQYGSQALKDALDKTGLGNHPELVRMFAKIGQAMSEDRLVKPGTMTTTKKALEDVFYGGQTNN